MKSCACCSIVKPLELFIRRSNRKNKYGSICKECRNAKQRIYIQRPEVKRKRLDYKKRRRKENPAVALKEYQDNSEYVKRRTRIDPVFKLRRNLRIRVRKAIKDNFKTGSAVRDLGCSIEFLKIYLESLFQPGMSWDNYGKWHIDHIIALSTVDLTDREQFKKVVHYTNLQPLWAIDNILKGAS